MTRNEAAAQAVAESDATAVAAAIRGGQFSVADAVEAAIEGVAERDVRVNSCAFVLASEARAAAESADAALAAGADVGPLHGVPVGIKDHIFVEGAPATMANRSMRDYIAAQDAVVVERLRAAGAIPVVKTTNSEFCWHANTKSALFGATRNPHDYARTVGGSSGGSAAAVAAGLVPATLGSDAGGSIRIPAAFCGVVGYKPTNGLVPRLPGFESFRSTNCIGPLTRSVRDAVLLGEVIAGGHPTDDLSLPIAHGNSLPGEPLSGRQRIAWTSALGDHPLTEDIAAALADVVAALPCDPTPVAAPEVADIGTAADLIFISEIGGPLSGDPDDVDDPYVRELFQTAVDGRALVDAHIVRARVAEAWARFFEEVDLLVLPTLPIPPFAVERPGPPALPGRTEEDFEWMRSVYVANMYRGPAVSVPVGTDSDGLPIGIQVMGPVLSDAKVLGLAGVIEAEFSDRR